METLGILSLYRKYKHTMEGCVCTGGNCVAWSEFSLYKSRQAKISARWQEQFAAWSKMQRLFFHQSRTVMILKVDGVCWGESAGGDKLGHEMEECAKTRLPVRCWAGLQGAPRSLWQEMMMVGLIWGRAKLLLGKSHSTAYWKCSSFKNKCEERRSSHSPSTKPTTVTDG